MFRTVRTHPSPHLQSLKRAVNQAETELWVPATVYRELADYGGGDQPVNPYLDDAIEEGWIRVATSLPGVRPVSDVTPLLLSMIRLRRRDISQTNS